MANPYIKNFPGVGGPAGLVRFDDENSMEFAPLPYGMSMEQGGNNFGGGWGDMTAYGKMATIGQGASAFSDLAGIYSAFKALNLQKKAFNFQKDAWNKNYANDVHDYENQLKDRWTAGNAAARVRGREYESMDSYLAPRKLTGTLPA
jgi:hypothetical protein